MITEKKLLEHRVMELAAYAGKVVLTNGGETYRVEEVVASIGKRFGLEINCFATLTVIVASGKNSNGEIVSLVERISERKTNLDIIHQIATVIKEIELYNIITLREKIEEIEKDEGYSFKYNLLASAMGSAAFIVSFNGGRNDFISAFIAGGAIGIFSHLISKLNLNIFFKNLISASICASISCFMYKIGFLETPSISIISGLMLLVPGVSFINAIRDIIAGDLVAGISRVAEVIMIGTSIALGAGIVLKFAQIGGEFI